MSIPELHKLFLASTGVSTDSRNIWKGCLYVSLKGERFNGNDFAVQALKEGAIYSIIDEEIKNSDRLIRVENGLQTLQDLAAFHRGFCEWPTLGITGSNGKTTTKELIGAVLSTKFNLLITEGNLNNHIGVPLTVLRGSKNHDVAIIELGASHPGDIAELCEIADPDLGLITNIGKAHLEGMGGIDGVLKTKGELFDHVLKKQGKLLLNVNQPLLSGKYSGKEYLNYGSEEGHDIQGVPENVGGYLHVNWRKKDDSNWRTTKTNLVGTYNLDNVLSAIAVGVNFGIGPEEIGKAIESYVPTNNRSEYVESGSNRIVWDAYNANPSSMESALENMSSFGAVKLVLILGEMKEVGTNSQSEHQALINQALKLKPVELFLVGESFIECEIGTAKHSNSVGVLNKYLSQHSISDALILIKGSRSNQLEKLKEAL